MKLTGEQIKNLPSNKRTVGLMLNDQDGKCYFCDEELHERPNLIAVLRCHFKKEQYCWSTREYNDRDNCSAGCQRCYELLKKVSFETGLEARRYVLVKLGREVDGNATETVTLIEGPLPPEVINPAISENAKSKSLLDQFLGPSPSSLLNRPDSPEALTSQQ